jgi:hypothetical protein
MGIKDSGQRYENELGGVRDTNEGKPNYTLIPYTSLKRVADHYTAGLRKYGKDNWKKLSTEQDLDRFKESAIRHLLQAINGETDEDHYSACIFNVMALMYFDKERKGE